MTTTLSPQSTCGVKLGRCLPLRRMAMNEARRPSTMPSASTRIHFLTFAACAGERETVDMIGKSIIPAEEEPPQKVADYRSDGVQSQLEIGETGQGVMGAVLWYRRGKGIDL